VPDDHLSPAEIRQLPVEAQGAEWLKVPASVMVEYYRSRPPVSAEILAHVQAKPRRRRGRPRVLADPKPVLLKFEKETLHKFDKIARKKGMTRAEVFRHLVDRFVDAESA
jgi:hypothetical protein